MSDPKSLMQYIIEAIDQALPPDSPTSGREIYLRGFVLWERENFENQLEDRLRELKKQLPLVAVMEK